MNEASNSTIEAPEAHGAGFANGKFLSFQLSREEYGIAILKVREIYKAYPAGAEHGRLQPLSAADTARLKARYDEDVEILATRYPGMFVQP